MALLPSMVQRGYPSNPFEYLQVAYVKVNPRELTTTPKVREIPEKTPRIFEILQRTF